MAKRNIRHWTQEERIKHLKAFESGDLNAKKYCEENDFPITTFYQWRKRHSNNAISPFVQIPVNKEITSQVTNQIIIKTHGGIKIEITGIPPHKHIGKLMEVLFEL